MTEHLGFRTLEATETVIAIAKANIRRLEKLDMSRTVAQDKELRAWRAELRMAKLAHKAFQMRLPGC